MQTGQRGEPEIPLVATTGSLILGGSSTFLLNLSKAFARRDYRLPLVVLTERIEHADDFASARAEVKSIETSHHIYEDRLAWCYQQVASYRPRAVLACLSAESFEVLRVVPEGVMRCGIIQSDDPGPYALVEEFVPWLDAVVGVSQTICKKLRTSPQTRGLRIELIPYGIDFGPAQLREQRSADEPLRVIYLGRLIEIQKRISRLANLILRLEQEKANIRFMVVGGGPDAASFRAALAHSSIVKICEPISNHEVADLLRQQDVYILLSDFEGLPLSLLEAMGEGVVPVVSDLRSGISEVVTSDCGFRVPVGDVGAAAEVLQRLAANRTELSRLSGAAMKRARENFSADLMAQRYLRMISKTGNSQEEAWPAEIAIPPPRMLSLPWAYQGWPRKVRRFLKRLL